MYRWTFNFLVLPDGSQSLGGMVVTPGYFRVLGLRPILGREFNEAELGRPNVPPSAIILEVRPVAAAVQRRSECRW